jgi:hypothetical protein
MRPNHHTHTRTHARHTQTIDSCAHCYSIGDVVQLRDGPPAEHVEAVAVGAPAQYFHVLPTRFAPCDARQMEAGAGRQRQAGRHAGRQAGRQAGNRARELPRLRGRKWTYRAHEQASVTTTTTTTTMTTTTTTTPATTTTTTEHDDDD